MIPYDPATVPASNYPMETNEDHRDMRTQSSTGGDSVSLSLVSESTELTKRSMFELPGKEMLPHHGPPPVPKRNGNMEARVRSVETSEGNSSSQDLIHVAQSDNQNVNQVLTSQSKEGQEVGRRPEADRIRGHITHLASEDVWDIMPRLPSRRSFSSMGSTREKVETPGPKGETQAVSNEPLGDTRPPRESLENTPRERDPPRETAGPRRRSASMSSTESSAISGLTYPTGMEYFSSDHSDAESYSSDDIDVESCVSGLTHPTAYGDIIDDDETLESKPTDLSNIHNFEALEDDNDDGRSSGEEGDSLCQSVPSKSLRRLANFFRKNVSVGDHKYRFKRYEQCFVGCEAVDFMVENKMAPSREDALFLGQRFVRELNLFHHVCWDHTFLKDAYLFYRFTEESELASEEFQGRFSESFNDSPALSPIPNQSGHSSSMSDDTTALIASLADTTSSPLPRPDLAQLAIDFRRGVTVSTHVYHFMKYKNTFVGSEAVDYMVQSRMAATRMDAVFLGQRLLEETEVFHHVKFDHPFKDAHLFYRFADGQGTGSSSSSSVVSGSVTSKTLTLSDHSQSVSGHSTSSGEQSVLKAESSDVHLGPGHDTESYAPSVCSDVYSEESWDSNQSPEASSSSTRSWRFRSPMGGAPRVPVRVASVASDPRSNEDVTCTIKPNRVTFGTVETRVYENILDVNPATSSGPSVGLGWMYQDASPRTVEESEDDNWRKPDFVITRQARESLLEELGYSKRDISRAVRLNRRAKEQRKESLNSITARSMSDQAEKRRTASKVGGLLRLRGSC